MNAQRASRHRRLALLACTTATAFCAQSVVGVANAEVAGSKRYTETIPGTAVRFEMVSVPAGRYRMGSPADEAGRKDDEGPQADVAVKAFWIGKHEVTWAEYDLYRKDAGIPVSRREGSDGDAVTRPTPPYADESWGFGKGSQPAIGMTWHAAMAYCRWLSAKTGHSYRLPTEAEWEYAARAGSATPWSSGDEASLSQSAWYAANANGKPHKVGGKQANALGLHDMHGNVAEWTLDQYQPQRYAALKVKADNPVALPGAARFPHVVRGGSFEDAPAQLRSAARRSSKPAWSRRDPQEPRSIWWHTDATFVGFRVVRVDNDPPKLKNFNSKVTRASPDQ